MAEDHTFDFLESNTDPANLSSDNWDLDAFLADLNLNSEPAPSAEGSKERAPQAASESPFFADDFFLTPSPMQPNDDGFISEDEKSGEADAPEQQAKPKKKKKKHSALNAVLTIVALILVAGIAAVIYLNVNGDPIGSRILPNVSIAGVNVGEMTREQAIAAVNEGIGNAYSNTAMVVSLGKTQVVLSPANTLASLNVQDAVNAAYDLGRTGTAADRQKTHRLSQTSQIILDITEPLGLNVGYIRSTIESAAQAIGTEFEASGYELIGTKPALDAESFDADAPCQTLALTIGKPASRMDLDTTCTAILQAYSSGQFQVTIPEELVAEYPADLDLDAIFRAVNVPPVEATQEVPGSCGYTFSMEQAKQLLSAASYGDVVLIPLSYVVPEDLEANGEFTETVSTFSTVLSDSKPYRANAEKICSIINGTVVEPGQSFSLRAVVGLRTIDRGYVLAPCHGIYCTSEEVGGGADQVASTLYAAVLQAGLNIVEKHVADHICPYTIKGTEVSIAGNWQDLKFSNNLGTPIMIRAKVAGDRVSIRVLARDAQDFIYELDPEAGYEYNFGSMIVEKKADSGYQNGQILVEGVKGGAFNLQIIKRDKQTGQEVSVRRDYITLHPVTQVTVRIR